VPGCKEAVSTAVVRFWVEGPHVTKAIVGEVEVVLLVEGSAVVRACVVVQVSGKGTTRW